MNKSIQEASSIFDAHWLGHTFNIIQVNIISCRIENWGDAKLWHRIPRTRHETDV